MSISYSNNTELLTECLHESCSPEGECETCGLCIGGSATATHIELTGTPGEGYHHACVASQASFANDLKILDLPDDVRAMALSLASSTQSEVHRMGVRKQLLFLYIYLAFLNLGKVFRPEEIAKKIGIEPTETSQALRLASGTSTERISLPRVDGNCITAPVVIISPVDYIDSICIKYGYDKYIKPIVSFTHKILAGDKLHDLLARKPIHVAIALIKYYLESEKVKVPKDFARDEISPVILKQQMANISKIAEKLSPE